MPNRHGALALVAFACPSTAGVCFGLFACNAILGIGEPIDERSDVRLPDGTASDASDARGSTDDSSSEKEVQCPGRPPGSCAPFPQCGCTELETCDVVASDGLTTCTVAGKAPLGHPCTSTAGCMKDLTCVFGTCHPFCETEGSACPSADAGECFQVNKAGGGAIPGYRVCRLNCAPENPTACGGITAAGSGVCLVDSDGGTDCQAGGTRTEGQPCTPTDDCGPALVCVQGTPTACRRWCRVGQAADCALGTCKSFAKKVIVRGVEYGACL